MSEQKKLNLKALVSKAKANKNKALASLENLLERNRLEEAYTCLHEIAKAENILSNLNKYYNVSIE